MWQGCALCRHAALADAPPLPPPLQAPAVSTGPGVADCGMSLGDTLQGLHLELTNGTVADLPEAQQEAAAEVLQALATWVCENVLARGADQEEVSTYMLH